MFLMIYCCNNYYILLFLGTLMSGEVIDQEFIDVTQQEEEDSPTCSRPEAIEVRFCLLFVLNLKKSVIGAKLSLPIFLYLL